jgi:hypothetical protein
MTDNPKSRVTDGVPTYTGGGDPAGRFTDYYPAWLDNLADDVTVEGSLLDGAAQGVRREPIGCVVLVTRNAGGQAQHVAANYRPRSSLLLLSRLVGEKLAGTAYAKYFLASES